MPTLNASSSDLRDRLAAEQEDDQPLLGPGAAGRRREERRERVDDLREQRVVDRRVDAERLEEEVERRDPEAPTRSPAARCTPRTKPAAVARGSRSRAARARGTRSHAGAAPTTSRRAPRAGATASPIARRALVTQEEPPVDGRDARVDLVRRQHADRERPDDQAAGDDEVEHRLDDQRRRERRVARAPAMRCLTR